MFTSVLFFFTPYISIKNVPWCFTSILLGSYTMGVIQRVIQKHCSFFSILVAAVLSYISSFYIVSFVLFMCIWLYFSWCALICLFHLNHSVCWFFPYIEYSHLWYHYIWIICFIIYFILENNSMGIQYLNDNSIQAWKYRKFSYKIQKLKGNNLATTWMNQIPCHSGTLLWWTKLPNMTSKSEEAMLCFWHWQA